MHIVEEHCPNEDLVCSLVGSQLDLAHKGKSVSTDAAKQLARQEKISLFWECSA